MRPFRRLAHRSQTGELTSVAGVEPHNRERNRPTMTITPIRLAASLIAVTLIAGCASSPPPPVELTPAPAPSPAANTLGDDAMQAGDYRQAVDHYTQWLIDHPKDTTVAFRKARCHEYLGEWKLAIEGYSFVIELLPDDVDSHLRRAGCRYRIGDLAGADADVRVVLSGDFEALAPGKQVVALALAGQLRLAANQAGAALTPLDHAAAIARDNKDAVSPDRYAAIQYNRAMALFAVGAHSPARAAFEDYVAVRQERGHAVSTDDLYHLVLLAYLAGDYARAEKLLPGLPAAERATLAGRLQDPDFFLTDAELRRVDMASK